MEHLSFFILPLKKSRFLFLLYQHSLKTEDRLTWPEHVLALNFENLKKSSRQEQLSFSKTHLLIWHVSSSMLVPHQGKWYLTEMKKNWQEGNVINCRVQILTQKDSAYFALVYMLYSYITMSSCQIFNISFIFLLYW